MRQVPGAGGENRTLTMLPSADFESAASTVPPRRLCVQGAQYRALAGCRARPVASVGLVEAQDAFAAPVLLVAGRLEHRAAAHRALVDVQRDGHIIAVLS